jgi:hypothetical protein
MSSIRNRIVVSLLSVLAFAAVAADMVGKNTQQSATATQTTVSSQVATFKDLSVPKASVVFEGVEYTTTELPAQF